MGILQRLRGGAPQPMAGGAGRPPVSPPRVTTGGDDGYGGYGGPPRPNPANRDRYLNAPSAPSPSAITFGNHAAHAYQTSMDMANQYSRMAKNPYISDSARGMYTSKAQAHQGWADFHSNSINENARNLDIWRNRK